MDAVIPSASPAAPLLPWFARPAARAWTCASVTAGVEDFHSALPGYAPTPLTESPGLAAELGVGRVFVKDEAARMGLAAFKVLGASWAVQQVLMRQPAGTEVLLVTASDGNHGRAVAWMARLHGHRACVFVPSGVHPVAVAAIAAEGAQIVQVSGSYDQAVQLAAEAARQPSAALVQDTAWPGYEQVPDWSRYRPGSARWLRLLSRITAAARTDRLRRCWPWSPTAPPASWPAFAEASGSAC